MKKTLVIGASLNPTRYSNLAINRLSQSGYSVEAVGLREGIVAGVSIKKEKVNFNNIDTITLYVNASRQPDYYDYIVSLNPKRIIFNPGTENTEFYDILEKNNIEYEVACTLVLLSTNQY
jgi:predicted CoA-binding protein